MTFEEKYTLIKQTAMKFADKYGMLTTEDLINEAWLHKEVREAEEEAHVVKATKDACVDFLRRWCKTGGARNKREIKITHISSMKDNMNNISEYTEDNTTELLKVDLCKLMNKEERKIVEYRMQGWTYKEIAAEMYYKKVCGIHKRMQKRMCKMKKQLLGD